MLAGKTQNVIVATDDPDVLVLEGTIAEQLGTVVNLEQEFDGSGGKLVIKYYDADTLAGLLERMNISYE